MPTPSTIANADNSALATNPVITNPIIANQVAAREVAGGALSGGALSGGALTDGALTDGILMGEAERARGLPQLASQLAGFNAGAFLLNRLWLGAHNTQLGCFSNLVIAAPYSGILGGLVFGWGNKIAWALLARAVSWLVLGLKAND